MHQDQNFTGTLEADSECPQLSIITAAAPDKTSHLEFTAESVRELREHLPVQWIVIWDGIETPPVPGADIILTSGHINSGLPATRNIALTAVKSPFVLTLDANEQVVPAGVLAALEIFDTHPAYGWVGANTLINSEQETTPSERRVERTRDFAEGALAEYWDAPFLYHPGSTIYCTGKVLERGGWPAMVGTSRLGLLLQVSEYAPGAIIPETLIRRSIAEPEILGPQAGQRGIEVIRTLVNAHRATAHRSPIQ